MIMIPKIANNVADAFCETGHLIYHILTQLFLKCIKLSLATDKESLMNRIIPLICAFPFLLSGCLMLPSSLFDFEPEQRTVYVPVEEPVVQAPQVLELTVIEGKTTKQEVINALGTPKSMTNIGNNEQMMIYYYIKGQNVICRLKLKQKDGTVWNEVLGDGNLKSVNFTVKRGIVQTADLG